MSQSQCCQKIHLKLSLEGAQGITTLCHKTNANQSSDAIIPAYLNESNLLKRRRKPERLQRSIACRLDNFGEAAQGRRANPTRNLLGFLKQVLRLLVDRKEIACWLIDPDPHVYHQTPGKSNLARKIATLLSIRACLDNHTVDNPIRCAHGLKCSKLL